MGTHLSIILPAYNEAENLTPTIEELVSALDVAGLTDYEILVVDDGSLDDTQAVLEELRSAHRCVRSVQLRRNFGKSAALQAGFAVAQGSLILLMDADGQDDPSEIPKLVEALNGGSALVTGQRVQRKHGPVKRVTSRMYNRATSMLTGVEGRDFNSGLKVMRRDVAESLNLYGELHRYIPVLAHWAGFQVEEIPVQHRPRLHGQTKFGASRFWRGFFDLFTVHFLTRFTARPLHLFGGLSLFFGAGGFALLAWMLVLWLVGEPVGGRPALLAGILLVVVAVQLFSLGLLGQLIVHTRGPTDPKTMIDDQRDAQQ